MEVLPSCKTLGALLFALLQCIRASENWNPAAAWRRSRATTAQAGEPGCGLSRGPRPDKGLFSRTWSSPDGAPQLDEGIPKLREHRNSPKWGPVCILQAVCMKGCVTLGCGRRGSTCTPTSRTTTPGAYTLLLTCEVQVSPSQYIVSPCEESQFLLAKAS